MPTVLVAGDDRDVREVAVFKLEQSGYEVILAEDAATALAQARSRRPDLAVLDVMMPRMTGLDVCRAPRAEPETAGIRVILLAARAQESDVEDGFTGGADDYLTKPFSPRELGLPGPGGTRRGEQLTVPEAVVVDRSMLVVGVTGSAPRSVRCCSIWWRPTNRIRP
ncbi:response regulator transcription factor [Pseudonocardia bannensis]|uniref:response regulator transcription factor n=1 Tax=Pseudonocardia bannensis TaxID=630973 RepID=UPI001B7CF897|nr:response regulator [Pseudonocardia bannensis]